MSNDKKIETTKRESFCDTHCQVCGNKFDYTLCFENENPCECTEIDYKNYYEKFYLECYKLLQNIEDKLYEKYNRKVKKETKKKRCNQCGQIFDVGDENICYSCVIDNKNGR